MKHFSAWLITHELDSNHLSFLALTQIWAFGYKWSIPELQDDAINAFAEKVASSAMPTPADIRFIYQKTTAGANLRNLLVETSSNIISDILPTSGSSEDQLPIEFTTDLLAFEQKRKKPNLVPMAKRAKVDASSSVQTDFGQYTTYQQRLIRLGRQ